jgi:protein-export membrane protein SecD/preprotein translocase SecF subunit
MAPPKTAGAPWAKLALTLAVVGFFAWRAFPIRQKITFGLDLQGGSYMVLRVELDEAVRGTTERTRAALEKRLRDGGITFGHAEQVEIGHIQIVDVAAAQVDAARDIIEQQSHLFDVTDVGGTWDLRLKAAAASEIRDAAARQVKDTIGRRINEFGVGEPLLQQSGDRGERLVLQLPGLDDVARVKGIITRASVMEFRLGHGEGPTVEAVTASLGGNLPADIEILPKQVGIKDRPAFVAVSKEAVARGEDLLDARAGTDRVGRPSIGFTLTPQAGDDFGRFTAENKGKPLAIVLDGHVVQYANIRDQIFSSGEISGSFTQKEAQDAALTLRSGSLPAKVTILEERTVGPSLGRDSVDSGFRATLAGFLAVMVFLLLWYKGAGVNAVVALAMNVVIVLGMLAVVDATLTLPGIAGLILTLVSAVDANVIVFERIKEELAAGRTPAVAVDAGFDKALSAIVDSNVTTLIASFFLYNFGTGPIKGFGVTLAFGIVASMFTAIYVSRALFELLLWVRPGMRTLSIMWRPPKAPYIKFMRFAAPACALSGIVVLASLGLWLVRGLDYGIDFKGGTQVIVQARPGTTADGLRERLAGTEFSDVTIQGFGREGDGKFLLRILGDKGAAMAEETRDVNTGAEGGGTQNGAAKLSGLLSGVPEDRLDLNSIGTQALADSLAASAGLPADQALTVAKAITTARAERGGLLATVDPLAGIDVPAAAKDWLTANAVVSDFAVVSSESVGSAIGPELRDKAGWAVRLSLLFILGYVAFRFRFSYGLGAVVALAHDVIVAIGVLALLHIEFDINVIAALLTLAGYSLNDTIVIFDRVRENARDEGGSLAHLLDLSVSQCLSRTFLTAGTSLFAIVAILLFGGPVLYGFALALTVGMIAGTYSTVFVASPIVLLWERARAARTARREAATA